MKKGVKMQLEHSRSLLSRRSFSFEVTGEESDVECKQGNQHIWAFSDYTEVTEVAVNIILCHQ